ncbi:MAG TPA: hypothetical protein VLH15_10695 [Dehalococcoidales bacterium]|nr:hypothetical protein [Dehalococcoidales bacterium]
MPVLAAGDAADTLLVAGAEVLFVAAGDEAPWVAEGAVEEAGLESELLQPARLVKNSINTRAMVKTLLLANAGFFNQ